MAMPASLKKLVTSASQKYARSSGTRLRPKEGRNRFRFLAPSQKEAPWVKDDGQFWADLGVHWIKAEKNGKPMAVVGCRDIVYGEPCEIDTAIMQAESQAYDEDTKELIKEWKARKSVLVNVINRTDDKAKDGEVEILELTPTTWAAVLEVIQQYLDEDQDVTDLEDGLDIVITRSGKGLNTEYTVNAAPGTSQPVDKKTLSCTHDLFAHIEKEFFRGDENKALAAIGQAVGIDTGKIAAIAGRKTGTKALTSAGSEVDDASEDELETVDISDEIDEVEEEAAPKKTTKKVEKPAEPDDAEMSDDEMDDILKDLEDV